MILANCRSLIKATATIFWQKCHIRIESVYIWGKDLIFRPLQHTYLSLLLFEGKFSTSRKKEDIQTFFSLYRICGLSCHALLPFGCIISTSYAHH
jgi:hypothetical protein